MTVKWFVTLTFLLGLMVSTALAQGRGGPRHYDPKTETTVKGTVTDVQQPTGRRGAWTGTHLIVKTDGGDLDVHVGPSSYISEKQFSFAKGDAVEVVGSKVTIEGKEVVLAREITKDGKTLILRDAQGIPQWFGKQRQSK
jgi:hypothetical protein